MDPSSAVIERAQSGDETAFREVFDAHRHELHRHCYRMLGSFHDAEYALQWRVTGTTRGPAPMNGASLERGPLFIALWPDWRIESRRVQREGSEERAVIRPDYDSDPKRWTSWQPRHDVHEIVARELSGPTLDVGCGDGRLASLLRDEVSWIGVDSSPTQLASNSHRPVVLADMRQLPFRDGVFAEVTHLWCLYHIPDPVLAIREAWRVVRSGGRYFACTAARTNDPELMWAGYPPTPFDAEEAGAIVSSVFGHAEPQYWEGQYFALETRDEVRAYCRHHSIPLERAEAPDLPLWLTKRGVLVRATKH